ncbi:ankycorbin [Patella vulgata]|uniref:ankycorbin n=1 Tax=Patella vulgata TaxID=6465 RepID=UPI0021801F4A|nr:ankycorbin [Patella vulgata]
MTAYSQQCNAKVKKRDKQNVHKTKRNRITSVKMDDKEANDRLMAAEAMSALSSLVLVKNGKASKSDAGNSKDSKPARQKPGRKTTGTQGTRKAKTKAKNKSSVNNHDYATPGNMNNDTNCVSNNNNNNSDHAVNSKNVNTKNKKSINKKSEQATPNSGITTRTKSGNAQTTTVPSSSAPKTVTQCTQTTPSADLFGNPAMNLASLSLLSGNLLQGGFALTSLPSIPSGIDALKLTSNNIDLAALPGLNSVNLVLNKLATLNELNKETSSEGERSLPFKKRRYANTTSGTNADQGNDVPPPKPRTSTSVPVLNRSISTGSNAEKPAIRLFEPVFETRLMSEISVALQPDDDGDLPLHIAVVHENIRMIKKFIQLMKLARKSVDKFNKQKQTPLHLAIKLDLREAIKLLLDAQADVNYVDHTGCTSLHLTVKHQLPHIANLLFEHSRVEIEVNTRNFAGLTPLHTAVEKNDERMINLLLDKRVDVDALDGKSGRTALYHAVECEKKSIVSLLLKRGANPEIQNYAGNTAIMAAQARSFTDISYLLTSNVNDLNDMEVDEQSNEDDVSSDKITSEKPHYHHVTPVIQYVKSDANTPPGVIRVIDQSAVGPAQNKNVLTSVMKAKIDDFPAMERILQSNELHAVENYSTENLPGPALGLLENMEKSEKTCSKNNSKNRKSPDAVAMGTSTNNSKLETETVKISVTTTQTSEKHPAIVPERLISSARTPVTIPTGIQSYINPDLRAKIQQNLINKKLKAQLSEEKKD